MDLVRLGMIVLLANLVAMELYVYMGDLGLGQPISMRVCWSGTISLDVIKSVANSASAAEDMTNLIIWDMVSTGSLKHGIG